MSDPREPEDANSPWARPEQPASTPDSTQQAYQPQQRPEEQQWQPTHQDWRPEPQWQPQQQGWQAGPPPHGQPYPQQWAQQPGQPYFQGQPYPQQGYGEVPSTPTEAKKRSRAPLYIGLVVLVLGIGVAGAYFVTGRSTLDQQAAEVGVARVLTTSYGLAKVTDVSCPAGQQVKKNDTFTCTVRVDGESRDVTITFVDDEGTYEVGRPM